MSSRIPIGALTALAYTVPTDAPEADGTFAWTETTIIVVHVEAGGQTGVGYTYSHSCITHLITTLLASVIAGHDAMDPNGVWEAMQHSVRNLGRGGLAASAIAAVDIALWDLKAKLLGLPLVSLLGAVRDVVPIYGSGGFTSYNDEQISRQLALWAHRDGCRFVKMKVGSEPSRDPHRVAAAKKAIGDCALFVDANGAYTIKQALSLAAVFLAEADIRWFEEPVSSDDLEGLRHIRERIPAQIEIAAGEYGYDTGLFPPDAGSRSGGRAAGGCDPLWRRHRLYAGGGAVRRPSHRSFGTLRAGAASACCLRGTAVSASGMVPRPRPYRAHVVRRRPGAARRYDPARPVPPGHWG